MNVTHIQKCTYNLYQHEHWDKEYTLREKEKNSVFTKLINHCNKQ